MTPDFISTIMDKEAMETLPEILMFLSLAGMCVVILLIRRKANGQL